MSVFNQEAIHSDLQRGMKRGRSSTKELVKMPSSIKVRKDDGKVVVRYYDTDIVSVQSDRIVLKNGGWPTPSTRRYINAALATIFPGVRIGVNQSKKEQFLTYDKLVVPFYGYLTFNIVEGELIIFTT